MKCGLCQENDLREDERVCDDCLDILVKEMTVRILKRLLAYSG